MDKETGNTQYSDPRMEKGGEMVETSMRNPDGSVPLKLTGGMLQRRGVKMHIFELI